MQWLWTWGGVSFGYRLDYALFTHDGQLVGRFDGEEVYGADGRYLGELRQGDRLITQQGKNHPCRRVFVPARSACYERSADRPPLAMDAGYEDFPEPEALRLRTIQVHLEARERRFQTRHPQADHPPSSPSAMLRQILAPVVALLSSARLISLFSCPKRQQGSAPSLPYRSGERHQGVAAIRGSIEHLRRLPTLRPLLLDYLTVLLATFGWQGPIWGSSPTGRR